MRINKYLFLFFFTLAAVAAAGTEPTPTPSVGINIVDGTLGIGVVPEVRTPSCPDAKYIDNEQNYWICKNCRCVEYYPELEFHDNDQGTCGLPPFETGTWDPLYRVCRRHDAKFDYQKDHDGELEESILQTQGMFVLGAAKQAAIGAFSIAEFFFYTPLVIVIGTGLELGRRYLKKKRSES